MCKHTVLAHHQANYILFCNGCGNYQLTFGTSVVTFEVEDYKRFYTHIAQLKSTAEYHGFEKNNHVCVNINCSKAIMILNDVQLYHLNALLEEALFSEEVEFILEECHIKQSDH